MTPQKYFPVFAQVRIQAPHVFSEKLIPQEFFPACIGFVPGGKWLGVLSQPFVLQVVLGVGGVFPMNDPQNIWALLKLIGLSLHPQFQTLGAFPWSSFSWCLGKNQGRPPKTPRIFYASRPPEKLWKNKEKLLKHTRNTKEFPWLENTKENQNTKEWKIRV